MYTNEIYTNADQPQDRQKVKEAEITGKDMLALTIAAYQVLLPFLAIMLFSYGGLILLFKIITR